MLRSSWWKWPLSGEEQQKGPHPFPPNNTTSSGNVDSLLSMTPLWGQRAEQGQSYSNKVMVEDKLINAFLWKHLWLLNTEEMDYMEPSGDRS